MLQLFQHQHAGAAGDDEAVSVEVVGPAGDGGAVIEFRRHRAHRVEEVRHRPVEILVAAGEHHVLLAPLDELVGIADAMRRGRARRGDRIVDAVNLEPGRQCRGCGGGHCLRHGEGADALGAVVLAGDVGGFDENRGRGTARTHDDAGTLVGYIAFLEPGILDRLLHGDVVPLAALGQETQRAPVDQRCGIERRRAPDLAAETVLGEAFGKADA